MGRQEVQIDISTMCANLKGVKMKWPLSFMAGISAILVYLVFTVISYLQFPDSYGPLTNWLSDLGNPQTNPQGAVYYNLGCILTALVLVGFYLGLRRWNINSRNSLLMSIALAAGALASISLVLAALFPLGANTTMHAFWSKMVSVFLGFFLTFSATALLRRPGFPKWIVYYAFGAATVNFVYGAFLPSVFVAEWISLGMFALYVFMLAYNSKSFASRPTAGTLPPQSGR